MQTLKPKMLTNEANAKLHGDFSTNLCQNALHDAFKRVCPVCAGGHECGCLSFLGRMASSDDFFRR